jgi:YD repeat-containing protein
MLKERVYHANDPEESGSARISCVKTYKTAAGPLFLRSCCSPSFVEGLRVDEGLHAFARLPEREHQLLLSIAQQPGNRLTLAYNASGNIVGEVSLTPLDQWWRDIGNAYEIAVEIGSSWRKLGIAHHLLSFALEFESVEEYLIIGLGLSWHWDYEPLFPATTPVKDTSRALEMELNCIAAGGFERERRRRAQVKLLMRMASERSVLDVWL